MTLGRQAKITIIIRGVVYSVGHLQTLAGQQVYIYKVMNFLPGY